MDFELLQLEVEHQIAEYKGLYRDGLITCGELIDLIQNIINTKDVKDLESKKCKEKIDKILHKTIVSIAKKI